jgi:GntR family transcriptional regulator/MocR family aminotransferase
MLRPWKVSLGDRIDASRPTPLYMQIVHALIHEIQCGRLPPDTFLPSSRELADALGVNRKTVVLAYDDLIAQGWLEPSATRGTRVSSLLLQPDATARRPPTRASQLPGTPAYPFHRPPERPLALPSGPWLKLDEGSPDGRLFPHEILARAYRNSVQRAARDNRLLYQDPRGSPVLRESVAEMLRSNRGLAVTADNICITRGSQNGIYLAVRALARPGDAFVVEALTYEPAVAAFAACGGTVVPVALDRDGIDPDAVERACRRHRVRAIFLTPHHQFPTTSSSSNPSRCCRWPATRRSG